MNLAPAGFVGSQLTTIFDADGGNPLVMLDQNYREKDYRFWAVCPFRHLHTVVPLLPLVAALAAPAARVSAIIAGALLSSTHTPQVVIFSEHLLLLFRTFLRTLVSQEPSWVFR